jgi:pimeloyl-ACP methyl ester carboxylesterase
MSEVPKVEERAQFARPGKDGKPTFQWTLTDSGITDTVKLIAGPFDVLPVVFVPGIMGSNLKGKSDGKPVWRLDTDWFGQPSGLLFDYGSKGPGLRQKALHPDRCEVDRGGGVPKEIGGSVYRKETYVERGWGSVGQGSYHSFLLWLEEKLNPMQRNPALWPDYRQTEATISATPPPNSQPKLHPGIRMGLAGEPFGAEKQPFVSMLTDDLIARSKFIFPVYAEGYNWLASNKVAAAELQKRISAIIKENNNGSFRCEQVILVTHSMGGLVARACAQLQGMGEKIAGIVHGVMPAVGAAVAYRRCKIGMHDESYLAGLVIGDDGPEVTAVFAQAPGALQLLPSQSYPSNWLRIVNASGVVQDSVPTANDPYSQIYLRKDRWWGLVDETWLAPKDGAGIEWGEFEKNVEKARAFHQDLIGSYHLTSYVYYGADVKQKSFEKVSWRMKPGLVPDKKARPGVVSVIQMKNSDIRSDGTNPAYVGGAREIAPVSTGFGSSSYYAYETSYWELHCELQDGAGDGTVPKSSGSAPLKDGGGSIQQQFKLTGFGHEPSYKDRTAQLATLFSITKIVGKAKRPA